MVLPTTRSLDVVLPHNLPQIIWLSQKRRIKLLIRVERVAIEHTLNNECQCSVYVHNEWIYSITALKSDALGISHSVANIGQ